MPSLQLAALSAWIRQRTQVRVEEYHVYLDVAQRLGGDLYDDLCGAKDFARNRSIAIPEAFYAALLFPSERERISQAIASSWSGEPRIELGELLGVLDAATQEAAQKCAEAGHRLVGVTTAFFQTFGALYFAKLVRSLDPDCLLVLGGPEVPGEVGESILGAFPYVDFIVTGEGELPLQQMCDLLATRPLGEARRSIARIPGVQSGARASAPMPQDRLSEPLELRSLDDLPLPDFRGYFKNEPFPSGARSLHLPIETSRGCWWDRSKTDPHAACTFCNLNASWSAYRQKSSLRAAQDIVGLVLQHRCPRVMLVDNVLRQGAPLHQMMSQLAGSGVQLRLIAEAKATLRPEDFLAIRKAGVEEIQIGIESLSTRMLGRLINKGTTALLNLQAMRWIEELGIRHVGNIILGYPNAEEGELEETVRNLEYACCYQPLIGGRFSLGYYSPMYRLSQEFGIRDMRNDASFDRCLPPALRARFFSLEKDYDTTVSGRVEELWECIAIRLAAWQADYWASVERHRLRSLLLYRDAKDFLDIVDWRGGEPKSLRLEGEERAAYLAATSAKRLEALRPLFGRREALEEFVAKAVAAKIGFEENGMLLSLAVRENPVFPLVDLAAGPAFPVLPVSPN